MDDAQDRLQIGEFAELVGLSIPQLRRYDRLRLLEAAGRSAESGYRYYSRGQTGAARVIALLRSMDMPIAEIRRIVSGAGEPERVRIFRGHRARLEARLDEVRRLLEAVDAMTEENDMSTETCISSWLHLMPHIPVTDAERSITYYQEALGLRLDWRTADGQVVALSSGDIETLMLVPWSGAGAPPPQETYVYVEDPDALCAEYQQAGADIVSPVATRAYGMRDFVVRDPDGHTFILGCGTEQLREVADHYGISPDRIAVNPEWLERRKPRT
ncbi:VOC family protein [Nonomuraea sp. SYSU D8015]|uniref:VOC family protein n=1 Tax=Nonomuraea sp. SYSU D8015 TaxID=2593644 RepID=UPI00166067F4|nr:VOC family protein [Nonomuraea sp. SYSU D8015]